MKPSLTQCQSKVILIPVLWVLHSQYSTMNIGAFFACLYPPPFLIANHCCQTTHAPPRLCCLTAYPWCARCLQRQPLLVCSICVWPGLAVAADRQYVREGLVEKVGIVLGRKVFGCGIVKFVGAVHLHAAFLGNHWERYLLLIPLLMPKTRFLPPCLQGVR